jgi:hypothetical protein
MPEFRQASQKARGNRGVEGAALNTPFFLEPNRFGEATALYSTFDKIEPARTFRSFR